MDGVSCVSCVSWMYSVNAAETHETIYQEPVCGTKLALIRPIPARIGLLRARGAAVLMPS